MKLILFTAPGGTLDGKAPAIETQPRTVGRLLGGVVLVAGLSACGGGGGGGDEVDDTTGVLSVSVFDNATDRNPVTDAVAVLYQGDNVTIAETVTTGSDGIAVFPSVAVPTSARQPAQAANVSLSVAYQANGLAAIVTAFDVPAGNFTLYVDDDDACDEQGRIDVTASGITGAPIAVAVPYVQNDDDDEEDNATDIVAAGNASFTNMQVCREWVQDDGNVSALVISFDLSREQVGYGFAVDFPIGGSSNVDVNMTPTALNWSTSGVTSTEDVVIAAERKGVDYFISSVEDAGTSGSLPIADQFPADTFVVVGVARKPNGTQCVVRSLHASAPTDVQIDFPDTELASLAYDNASDTLSWVATGATGDALRIELGYDGDQVPVEWSFLRSATTEQMLVLPQLPAAVEAWLVDRDAFSVEVTTFDSVSLNGFAEFFATFVDDDPDDAADEDVTTCSLRAS